MSVLIALFIVSLGVTTAVLVHRAVRADEAVRLEPQEPSPESQRGLRHLSESRNPFGSDALCGFTPSPGENYGMTSEVDLVTCPECLLRVIA